MSSPQQPPQLSQFYEINYQKELGFGAWGHVYEGHRIGGSHQPTAIKVIQKRRLRHSEIKSTENEVKILHQLNHPNIIKFFNMYEDEVNFYLCFEKLSGGELFDRISKKKSYTELEARNVCKAILSAIKYCHDLDVVHRDLKPENLLMLDEHDDTNVKLIDFGFAAEASGLTLEGLLGTPIYMAPEIYRREKYGKPVDMWAFGVIVYVLLCGYAPFYHEKKEMLINFITTGKFAFHDEYWSNTSAEAKDFIRQLLEVDLDRRLTVDTAMIHPWLMCSANQLAGVNISSALDQLRRFNAKRKLRAVVQTIVMLKKWEKILRPETPKKADVAPLSNLVRQYSLVTDEEDQGPVRGSSSFGSTSIPSAPVPVPAPAPAPASSAPSRVVSQQRTHTVHELLREESEESELPAPSAPPLHMAPPPLPATRSSRADSIRTAPPRPGSGAPPPMPAASAPPLRRSLSRVESVIEGDDDDDGCSPSAPSPLNKISPLQRSMSCVGDEVERDEPRQNAADDGHSDLNGGVSGGSAGRPRRFPFDSQGLVTQLTTLNEALRRDIEVTEAKIRNLSTGRGREDELSKLTRTIEMHRQTIRTNKDLINAIWSYVRN